MLLQLLLWVIISLFGLIGGNATSYAGTELSSIHLDKAIHFLSPGGDVIFVKPGTYQIDGTEEWISLIREGEERNQAFLLAAQPVTHTESLDAPLVLSLGGEEDIHLIALFLNDRSGLWVTGSYSGIRARSAKTALHTKQRFLQGKMNSMSPSNKPGRSSGKQQDRKGLKNALKEVESMQEQVRNKRQMASTAFQNFDQKLNQQYNLLSSVLKALNEMRMGAVRNMM